MWVVPVLWVIALVLVLSVENVSSWKVHQGGARIVSVLYWRRSLIMRHSASKPDVEMQSATHAHQTQTHNAFHAKNIGRVDDVVVIPAVSLSRVHERSDELSQSNGLFPWASRNTYYSNIDAALYGSLCTYLRTQTTRIQPLLMRNASLLPGTDIFSTQVGSVVFLGIKFNVTLGLQWDITTEYPRVVVSEMNITTSFINEPLFRDCFTATGRCELLPVEHPKAALKSLSTFNVTGVAPVDRLPGHVMQRAGNYILHSALNMLIRPAIEKIVTDFLSWHNDESHNEDSN